MKIHSQSSLLGFAAASTYCLSIPQTTSAWSSVPARSFHSRTAATSNRQQANSRFHESILVRRSTAVAADEEAVASSTSPLLLPDEQVVAEGSIVSTFAGGLMAVHVLEDMVSTQNVESPIPEGIAAPNNAKLQEQTRSASATGDDLQGRNVIFPDQSRGIVVAHRPPVLFVYKTTTGSDAESKDMEGSVQILDSRTNVAVPPESSTDSKSVVDLVNDSSDDESYKRAVFSPIPQVKDIALINNPMLTGITMVDSLAPIGRGQNMLFVGHDLDDMRRYSVDFLSKQLTNSPDVKCVYAAIEDGDKVSELLEKQGIADSVQIVAPKSSQSGENVDEMSFAAEAVATASTACAVAESHALRDGAHSIVVVDTIDWHKKLWDGTTRVLVDVFGVDAVVQGDRDGGASSEMRAFFSTLIQRAAQYNAQNKGGSVTLLLLTQIPPMQEKGDATFQESDFEGANEKVKARIQLLLTKNIPLTAENLRKIDIPIPSASEGKRRLALQHVDDLISMSDGQVWFEEKLEKAGQLPAMDPQRSITRVGIGADTQSRADAPALRRIVEGMRLILSQAADMSGAEATKASEKQIRRQKAYLLAMHQPSGTGGRTLSESCAALLAASGGYLDEAVDDGALAGTEKGSSTITGLLEHLQSAIPEQMRRVDESLDMDEETKKSMSSAIESYLSI